jgi:hypothetical protein
MIVLPLLNAFPQAATKKNKYGDYPLHKAFHHHPSEKIVLQLLNLFPQAATEGNREQKYPVHLAIDKNQSDKIVFTLIDTNPFAVKKLDLQGFHPLMYAVKQGQSAAIIKVLETLREKSDYELKNCIDIPLVVRANGLVNRRRQNGYHWLMSKIPTIQKDGSYILEGVSQPTAHYII